MLNWKLVSWSLGIWAAISFIVCVLWGLVTPDAVHMHEFLEQVDVALDIGERFESSDTVAPGSASGQQRWHRQM